MGSRNTSVRTGRQKVSQVTDNTRPPGLTTLVPTRVFRDFSSKTAGSFRTTPTAAAVLRRRNHTGANQFANIDWHEAFGLEEYGHGNYGSPAYDTGSGEFTSPQYSNMGAVGGGFATADSRLINDATVMTDAHVQVLDVKMSRDGRYTYVLSASMLTTVASAYFNVYDNLTGTQLAPTLSSSSNPTGVLTPARTAHEPLVSAWGSIAVVDDTTSQDASHHMAYSSAVFTVQFVTNSGGGNFTGSHAVFRFDYAANNVDEMYSGGFVGDFVTTNSGTNAWCEIQLVTQVGGVLKAMLAYRSTVTGASPDAGVPAIAMWTTWTAGDNPSSGPITIATATIFDFGQPPTTAVSQRGAPSASRRFYLYRVGTGGANLGWLVLNPATFFGGGTPDQDITFGMPAGTTYIKMKASAMPPAFVDGSSHAHMFVAFVWKNTTSNVTNVQSFLHTTVTTGTDTATSSLSSNPPGVTIVTFANSTSPTLDVGVVVETDPLGTVAAAAVAFLHPSGTYTQVDVRFTDPTDMTKIFPQFVDTGSTAGSTNTALNTLPASNRNGFAFGSTYWDFSATENKNDVQALAFTTTPQLSTFLRVVAPYAAIALAWDADVFENLPNPTDANTNSRTTTFYARATGHTVTGVHHGALLYTWSVGGWTLTTASNAVDLTGSFTSTTATTTSPVNASLETTPAFTHPDPAETTSITATMVDEFTFNVSNWNGSPAILSGAIVPGMTIGIQDPFSSDTTYVRYTLAGVSYDSTGRTITQFSISQPAPFHVSTAVYNVTVSAGPSTAIRQLLTNFNDNESNNRNGCAVFPAVVQCDYVSLQSNADHSEIAEMVIPLGEGMPGAVPTSVQVQIRGYNLDNTTIPSSVTNGIMVGVSLDSGTTWVTKSIQIHTTSVHGQTLATSFGVQSFHGASDLNVPWVTVPAGIDVGDWLVINAGPNAGRYLITEVTNDSSVSGPRIMLDRPFPVPGSSTIETWYVVSAGEDYEGDGTIPNLGFSSLGMNIDLTGLPVDTSNSLHARIEFKDGVSGHDVTYEIDSVSVQWTP